MRVRRGDVVLLPITFTSGGGGKMADISRVIGSLPPATMTQIEGCLKAALAIP